MTLQLDYRVSLTLSIPGFSRGVSELGVCSPSTKSTGSGKRERITEMRSSRAHQKITKSSGGVNGTCVDVSQR